MMCGKNYKKTLKSFQGNSHNSALWNMYTRLSFSNNHTKFIFRKEKKPLKSFIFFLICAILNLTDDKFWYRDTFHNNCIIKLAT